MRLPVPGVFIVAVVIPVTPERARFVAPALMKSKYCAVRHFVLIDGKRRDVDGVGFILVVPAKRLAAAFKTERDDASRDFDDAMSHRRGDNA